MKVRVLGCSGAIEKDSHTTSFLVDESILIDAGTGVAALTLHEMALIDDVFISHSHLDHVAGLAMMVDAAAVYRSNKTLRVHALPETIDALHRHLFNDVIWPDFTRLPSLDAPMLSFHPLRMGDTRTAAGRLIEALPANHTVPAVGYAVRDAGNPDAPWWVCSGDTGPVPELWQRLRQMKVGVLVIETAFSDREQTLARIACHLTPADLAQELDLLTPDSNFPIYIFHTKPAESVLIMSQINAHAQQRLARRQAGHDIRWLSQGHIFRL